MNWNLTTATHPVLIAALLEHVQDLGYTVRDTQDAVWQCTRPSIQCGRYVFTLDIYDSYIILGICDTPVSRDRDTVFFFELVNPDSLDKLERILRFASTNTTQPLYMHD